MKICTIPCGTAFMYEHSIYYRNSDGSYTNSSGDTDSYENHFGPDRKLRYEKVIRLQSKKISEVDIEASRKWLEKGKSLFYSGKHQDAIKVYAKAFDIKTKASRLNQRFDKAT